MIVRLNRIHHPVTALGFGRRIGIWFQGCTLSCKGCISRDTWSPDDGWEIDTEDLASSVLAGLREGLDGVTISGGEPFQQPRALEHLLILLTEARTTFDTPFDILCYSGHTLSELEQSHEAVLHRLDALVPEPYDATAGPGAALRGSANQKLVALSPLGGERYDAATSLGPGRIQISVADGAVWMIGIPRPGDLTRAQRALRAKGITLNDVSWLS